MAAPWKQKASKSEWDESDLAPAGNHPAVCVALIDYGTHESNYNGNVTNNRKVFIAWELVEAPGKPVIGKDFTLSLNVKALLRQFIDSWRGVPLKEDEEFDISRLAGQACLLNVIHDKKNDRTYAKVKGVSPVPKVGGKKIPVSEPSRPVLLWCLDDGNEDALPEWLPWLYGRPLSDWIKTSQERTRGDAAEPEEGEPGIMPEDTIPF